jgi:hypothetical protein
VTTVATELVDFACVEFQGLLGVHGAAVYEEGIRVPLYVRDPHGQLTPRPGDLRTQLTSSVDLAPLLLTIGHGGNGWRSEERYSYLANRADLAGIAADASAPGWPWIAHATDDLSVEEMAVLLKFEQGRAAFGIAEPPTEIPSSAPSHIVAVRTRDAKLATYSYWTSNSTDVDTSRRIDRELYDYSTPAGRHEIDNQAGRSRKQATLQSLLDHEVLGELRAPLPDFLRAAQEQGLADMRRLAALHEG